ncbi:transposable element Tcb1 transposase [Trichonephila clavipes]|uniref:Transposable element Tcb1 transposase n=1 Tax=Trichonephila clavipes TaxID=2585209 RepID=A0A8X6UUP4_TRICX|nr:transposable element Tcb1 transposase [Trichonephila clavipes]
MECGKRMDMVDAWSPAEDSDLKNQCRVTAQGSLPFGSAGNLMTHPAIYESNDPPKRGNVLALPCRRNSTVQEIGSRVGRNQTTLMWICDRWMPEGTTDPRGRSHPPQYTTLREGRQIVRMEVMNRSVTSRTVGQHIESVTHHLVSAGTIRRRLEQSGLSARRPLLGISLMQNHRHVRRQWCDERRMWVAEWNEVVFTGESRICLQHHDGRTRVWRHRGERMLNSCVMHRHTGPAPGIMGLATAIIQQDNARPRVARIVQRIFVNHQIELLPWPAISPDLSPIENMWSMVAQRLTHITPPAATPNQLWQRVEAAWSAVPQ